MKKIFTFLFAILLSFNTFAQCPLTTAVDFTATDVHGTEVNLFEILDGGQYVLIDFFFTTCGPCQNAVPNVVESYYSFGCNMHDVYYLEIATGDTEAACLNWVNTYGVEYPTISGAAGGTSICSQYSIGAYPTVILIAPDHSILINDLLWPISSAQNIITALEGQGIEQHDCTVDPEVAISIDLVTETSITATFTPNESCATYYYMAATESEYEAGMASTGLALPEYIQTQGFSATDVFSHGFDDLTPNTDYLVCAVPADADGNLYLVVQYTVNTTNPGAEIAPDFTATDIEGNEINLYEILDAGQSVLINFFLPEDLSELIMPYMTQTYTDFGCNQHDVFYMEISPYATTDECLTWVSNFGVEYPTISRNGGGNTVAQSFIVGAYPAVMIINPDHTIAVRDLYPIESAQTIIDALEGLGIEQHACDDGNIEVSAGTFSIYPNPANGFVRISGNNLGEISVYNAVGQRVGVYTASSEIVISTTEYENGVYFVKIGNNTQRFVVTH